jgi:ABC-type multidrug transport system fused ATPase/permease subunit
VLFVWNHYFVAAQRTVWRHEEMKNKSDPVKTQLDAHTASRVREADQELGRKLDGVEKVRVWDVLKPLIRPWRGWLLLAITLNALHGISVSFQNLTPKWLISDVLKPADLTPRERLGRAVILGLAYLFFSAVGRMLVWHMGYRIFTRIRERMVLVLRARFFRPVNALCFRFHTQHSSGEIFNYLFGSPLAQIMEFYRHSSMTLAGAVMTIVSTLLMVGLWDPLLTVILFATALGSVLVMNKSRREMRLLHKDYQQAESGVSANVADVLRGSRAVKLYAMEQHVAEDFDRNAILLGEKSYRRDVRGHVQVMKYETLTYVGYGVLLVAAAWRYTTGHVDEGVVAAYLNCFSGVVGPLTALFTASNLWGGAQASIERIGTVLKTASTTPDPASATSAPPSDGDIVFDKVTFAYGPDLPPVLRDFRLTIPYGQRVALVGPSGAGKSTVSQLVLRLYDPQSGSVTLGAQDLRLFRGADLRRLFGVVPQDPFVFRSTIRDNVRVSRPDASNAEIEAACRRANAWEFIDAMAGGLDEPVGEGGATLSGGQRQRLAIARAMLADPPYYIFDEATSALDTLSEDLIQSVLEKELVDRTVIIIAHRLATVRHCDRILVIQDGCITEDGTYDALIKAGGLFAELVQGQRLT